MNERYDIKDALNMLRAHWPEIEADFERHKRRFDELAAKDHDVIGRVLRAHLLIEHFMNSFLTDYFNIDGLDAIKLSFIQKAKLLPATRSSASFVRPGIIQLNAVRNKFSHRLDHVIRKEELSAIYDALQSSATERPLDSPLAAIEAFTPMACAFLSVVPPVLKQMFAQVFATEDSIPLRGKN